MTVTEETAAGAAPVADSATAEPVPPTSAKPDYDGRAGELFKIVFLNTALNIVTLGIFRFWAKTRIRHFLWSHVSFAGDRFEYTGRGRELLIGFLVVLVILIPFIVLSTVLNEFVVPLGLGYATAVNAAYYTLAVFLIGVAVFRARRYRMSRTVWRGIRGGQTGSAVRYGLMYLGYSALAVLTLGLALPMQSIRLQRLLMDNTWFGDKSFRFEGQPGELFRIWIKYWLLLLPTGGLSYFWYQAAEFRYFASRTRYENLSFQSDLRGGRLFLINFLYFLAIGVSLALLSVGVGFGIAFVLPNLDLPPQGAGSEEVISAVTVAISMIGLLMIMGVLGPLMVTHPMLRILCVSLTVTGEQDFAAIAQSRVAAPGRGEGLADAFDVGDF